MLQIIEIAAGVFIGVVGAGVMLFILGTSKFATRRIGRQSMELTNTMIGSILKEDE